MRDFSRPNNFSLGILALLGLILYLSPNGEKFEIFPFRTSRRAALRNLKGDDRVKAVMLFSFPMTGANQVMEYFQEVTGVSGASVFGNFLRLRDGRLVREARKSIPINWEKASGPFLYTLQYDAPQPGQKTLVRSHCGGTCTSCLPRSYIVGRGIFYANCFNSFRYDGRSTTVRTLDKSQWEKSIHLIRNPFDTIAMRFLNELERNPKLADTYSADREGFQLWCEHQDTDARQTDRESRWFTDPDEWGLMTKMICRAETYKFIQFYNNLFYTMNQVGKGIDKNLKIEKALFHYEDFGSPEALTRLMDFTGYPVTREAKKIPFDVNVGLSHYFSETQQEAMKNYINYKATVPTKIALARYLEIGPSM
eukprot:CAMPEP_0178955768 /NCGR_PEP_ID=MMETSP0789-20121207/9810_1 /TAXON_ID=3005 /ORGANISM="Rhizosolenia setigera, Strain CCMP 1694" /LENGTH=365 /DNA_ID=CAMNT_0020637479 /DNA_START=63 /DNA_END=1160 /DNA_ORIENTATION=-